MRLQTPPLSLRRPSPGAMPARSILEFTMADASASETTGPVDTLSVVLKNDECGFACLHEAVDAFTGCESRMAMSGVMQQLPGLRAG